MALILTVLVYGVPLSLLVLLVVKLWKVWERRRQLQTSLSDFPGPTPHWLHGNTADLAGDYGTLLRAADYATRYDGAIPLWTGPGDCMLLALHHSVARAVFAGSDPKDEFSYSLLRGWMGYHVNKLNFCFYVVGRRSSGDGLLLSVGGKWDRTRRLLTPAFSVDILRSYVKTFRETSAELVNKWRQTEVPVEMFHHASLLTMDSMLRCLFGHHSHCQQERERHPYIQGVHTLSELIVQRVINPLHHWDFIYYNSTNGKRFQETCEEIHSFSRSLIRDRRRLLETETPGSRPTDFLDILVSSKDTDGKGLTDREIQDEVDTFMFAGHDSTASSLSWSLYNLAKHPHYQDACREEVNDVLNGRKDISWEDLSSLKLTTRCLYESMRLYPPVPNVSRFTDRDIPLQDGRVVPKGIRVGLSLFAMHRNPDIWHEPEEYYPERFESEELSSAAFFMPFSLGLRNCIGQHFALTQLKVAIATILRNFRLSLVPDHPVEPISLLILRSKDGIHLKLDPI